MILLPQFTATRRTTLDSLLNRVHCCKAEMLLDAIPDNSIDAIITSPPYDDLRAYKGFTWNFPLIACESYRVLKPGGVLVWVVGDATVNGSETLTSMRQALYLVGNAGFKLHDTMIWNKYLPGDFGKRYVQAFEYMFVLSKETVNTFNPIRQKNKSAGAKGQASQRNGGNTQNGHVKQNREYVVAEYGVMENVWRIQPNNHERTKDGIKHPAAFPEELAERHILTWTNPGDTVLDYFGGSGTTAKMARNNNRNYITCDLSAEYCDLMRRRLAQPYTPRMFQNGAA